MPKYNFDLERKESELEELRQNVLDWIRNFNPKPNSDLITDGNEAAVDKLKNHDITTQDIERAIDYLYEQDASVFENNFRGRDIGIEVAVACFLIAEAINNSKHHK